MINFQAVSWPWSIASQFPPPFASPRLSKAHWYWGLQDSGSAKKHSMMVTSAAIWESRKVDSHGFKYFPYCAFQNDCTALSPYYCSMKDTSSPLPISRTGYGNMGWDSIFLELLTLFFTALGIMVCWNWKGPSYRTQSFYSLGNGGTEGLRDSLEYYSLGLEPRSASRPLYAAL